MSARRARGTVGRCRAQRRLPAAVLLPAPQRSSCHVSACAAVLELPCFRLRRGAPVRGGLG